MNDPRPDEFDDWLSGQLRELPLPRGLTHRLQQIAAPTDAELDALLGAVELPPGLMLRLLQQSPELVQPRRVGWRRGVELALAASLVGVLATSWLVAVAGSVTSALPSLNAQPEGTWLTTSEDSFAHNSLANDLLPATFYLPASTAGEKHAVADSTGANSIGVNDAATTDSVAAQTLAARLVERSVLKSPLVPIRSAPTKAGSAPRGRSPQERELVDAPLALERWTSRMLVDPGLQTALAGLKQARAYQPPSATAPRLPLAPQADLALASAVDLSFLTRVGMFPAVLTGNLPGVAFGTNVGTASYDTARRSVEQRQLPEADRVRTEEWLAALAALSAPAPVAPKPLVTPSNPAGATDKPPGVPAFALTLTAGPSPFGGGTHLVHVGLGLRDQPAAAHRPTHLVLVVDTTAPMALAGRSELVRRALLALPKQLAAQDRVSLVRWGAGVDVLLTGVSPRDLGGAEARPWLAALKQLQPAGGSSSGEESDPAAGIAWGLSTARDVRLPPGSLTRVVVLTHAGESWDETAWPHLRSLLSTKTTPANERVALDVLPIRPIEPVAPSWQQLASAGGGAWVPCVHAAQLQGRLLESLSGRGQVVLKDARISLTFPPQNVLSYRLLGHEPPRVPGIEVSQIDRHLYAGQTTSVLFEVRPTPGRTLPPDADLATVTLEWRDGRDGSWVKSSRRLLAGQVKTTFDDAPPAWQLASLVGAAAEVTRRSPFAEQINFAEIAQRLRRLPAALVNRAEVADFLTLVEQLDQLSKRGAAPRDSRPK